MTIPLLQRRWWVAGAVCATVAMVGCTKVGPPPGPPRKPTVPAAGVVTLRGKPLAKANVTFHPNSGDWSSIATTDESGAFTLGTYGAADGAPAGGYRVSVAVSTTTEIEPGVLAPLPEGGGRSPVPLSYADPVNSGLTADIPEAGDREIRIDLK